MSHNLQRFYGIPRHVVDVDYSDTMLLPDTIISYNEHQFVQPNNIQGPVAAIQIQSVAVPYRLITLRVILALRIAYPCL
ncbi:hypothetical protein BGZ97_000839, partial [Linnemannia gamsii]